MAQQPSNHLLPRLHRLAKGQDENFLTECLAYVLSTFLKRHAAGMSNRAIARDLEIDEGSVRNILKRGVRNEPYQIVAGGLGAAGPTLRERSERRSAAVG